MDKKLLKAKIYGEEDCEYKVLTALSKGFETITEIHENFGVSKTSLSKYLGNRKKTGILIEKGFVEKAGKWRYKLTIDGENRRLFLGKNKKEFQPSKLEGKPDHDTIELTKKKFVDITTMLNLPKNIKDVDRDRIVTEYKEKVYPLMAKISRGINVQVIANTVFQTTEIKAIETKKRKFTPQKMS